MKIMHVPYCYYPDQVGGTEIYVESLAKELGQIGVQSVIAAPWSKTATYEHHRVKVRRYALSKKITDVSELYGAGDKQAAKEFSKILDEEKPDIVHMHAFTAGCSLRMIRAAKGKNIRTVFTYHTPTVSCPRGTLMLLGQRVCDGVLSTGRCASCVIQGLGAGRIVGSILGNIPKALAQFFDHIKLPGKLGTLLRMRALVATRQRAFRELMEEVDHVIAVCDWVKEVLRLNGVNLEKMSVHRQGLFKASEKEMSKLEKKSRSIKLVFLGRVHETKGIDVLLSALKKIDGDNIRLDVYGIIQKDDRYVRKIRKQIKEDPRVFLKEAILPEDIVKTLSQYDCLVVPSQWMETGPLVVLEAFAAGIPVIGTDLGGIAELVEDEENGLLFDPGSATSLAAKLEQVYSDRNLLARMKKNAQAPRTMAQVAEEMLAVYQSVLRSQKESRA